MSAVNTKGVVQVAANTTIPNQLTGTDVEMFQGPALVSLWGSMEDVGLLYTLRDGSSAVYLNKGVPNIEVAAGRLVKDQDGLVDQVMVTGSVHLFLEIQNTTGAALNANYWVQVERIPAGVLGS